MFLEHWLHVVQASLGTVRRYEVAIANISLQIHGGDPGIHPNLALPNLSTKVIPLSLTLAPYPGYYNNCVHRADAAKPAFANSL